MQTSEEIARQLQEWINRMQKEGTTVSIEDINRHLAEMMSRQNSAPKEQFNGFSSEQMTGMIYYPLEERCPVKLRRLTDAQIGDIPLMRQSLHLMNLLSEGELKLTAQEYLPPKIVDTLYQMGSHSWYSDYYKQKTEARTEEVRVLRVVLKECGLIKTRTGKMSLTAKGRAQLTDRNALLRTEMLFLFGHYNTGWLDGWQDTEVGNVGLCYSLWLLHRFGNEWRSADFYTSEYMRAFPMMQNSHAYESRVFERLFRVIGLCEISEHAEPSGSLWSHKVIKTDLVEKVFSFEEPK